MAMDFTPANRGPTQEATAERPAVAYKPVRTSPSMGSSTAPIPGADKPVQFRGVPQAPGAPGAAAGEGGGEEEAPPEEMAQRADLAKRLGLVAEKDKRAREVLRQATEARAALKAEQEAFAAEREEIRRDRAEDAARRRDPIKVLKDYGFSPEAALQFAVNNGKLTPEQEAAIRVDEALAAQRAQTEEQLQALREEQAKQQEERDAELEAQAKEAEEEAERVAVQEQLGEISEIITGDPDTFRVLNDADSAAEAVLQRVQEWWEEETKKRGGRPPPITTRIIEAKAKELEAEAQKELAERAEKLGFVKTGVPRLPQTLTNAGVQRRPAPAPAPRRAEPVSGTEAEETEAEKRRRVIGMLEQLKAKGGGSLR